MDRKIDHETLRQFVTDNFMFGQANGLADNDSFLEKGIIDSSGILELISFLEERYGIKVEDEDLIQQNLDSIANIAAFLERKVGARAQTAA